LSAGASPQTPLGEAYSTPPDPLAGLGDGAPGEGKEGGERKRREGRVREGRESRNAP